MTETHSVGADALRRVFGRGKRQVVAVDGVTFELEPGSCLGLLGVNGSGKSTTIRMVLGLLPTSGGALEVLGGRPGRREARRQTGYVPEEARRFGELSGVETVRLFAEVQGVGPRRERRARVEAALEDVGLDRKAWTRRTSGYSRGMARRLALAAAWVHRPRLLVLDEPTSGLDPLGVEEILRLLERHKAGGGSILLSTHDRVTAEGIADQALVLDQGKVVKRGTLASLLGGDASPSLVGLFREQDLA